MPNFDNFHTQLFSVTEILAKAAMAEINRCVGDRCAVFRLEISQSQREIESLKHKLQVLERDFMRTRKKKERVLEQEWSFRPKEGEEPTNVEEVESYSQLSIMGNQFRIELTPVKRVGLEDDLCDSVPHSASSMAKQPSPVGDCKNSDKPFGDLEQLRCSPAMVDHCSPAEGAFGQEWSSTLSGGEDLTAVEDVEAPSQPSITRVQFRPEPLPVKRERLEEDLCCIDVQPTATGVEQKIQTITVEEEKKPDTEPTAVGDPEELREQHRCGHSDEELSGLEVLVKAEQEEEHVARRLNRTGCELSTGRLNTLDSECVMYERDDHLWTSFTQGNSDIESNEPVCSNATEQCSLSLSIQSAQLHIPATMDVSGNTLSSFGVSYAEEFDKMDEKPSVCSEELRSEAIHTQQGQYRERLVHTVERENQTLLPQQQQHGPSVKHGRGSESPAQPHSGSQYETSFTLSTAVLNTGGSTLSTGAVKAGKKRNTPRKTSFRKRLFLVSIMEILAKAAVEEINRSVNDSCAVFRLEISQSQKEIETLKHKLQIVERELMKTRIRKTVCSPAERVLGQVWSSRSSEEELIAVEDVESPSQPSVARNQSRPVPFPIKRERAEEDLCCRDPQSSSTGEEQETQAVPFGHPEELREQHRCGHSDEELSGLEFVVKAEQEGEHVAQRLNQTGCELREGRFNTLGSEYVMYEGDNQMWTSFTQGNSDIESDDPVCSNATEQCSQRQSIHSQTQFLSVMEILGKAAVAEINRCVGDSCAVFRLEISQSQREIETLKHKLEMLERELMKTRRKKAVCSPAMMKNCPLADRVTGQEWSFRRRGGGKSTAVEEVESPLHSSTNQFKPDELPIKKETQEVDLIFHDQQPTPAREEQKRETTPAEMEQITQSEPSESEQGKDPRASRHPEELREQHICGHGDEELSGLEFVVKAEQEEEHVAQRLNQTGCELSAGRLNTLGSECVMYERDMLHHP
ncbi:hypothetical protein GJAV_G00093880 [Gymnothorax javanicus]|nr:hypothetical protein GJAV_G00093880 [Gymnothorax javanicus]